MFFVRILWGLYLYLCKWLWFLNLVVHKMIIFLNHLRPLINRDKDRLIANHILNLIDILVFFSFVIFILDFVIFGLSDLFIQFFTSGDCIEIKIKTIYKLWANHILKNRLFYRKIILYLILVILFLPHIFKLVL